VSEALKQAVDTTCRTPNKHTKDDKLSRLT